MAKSPICFVKLRLRPGRESQSGMALVIALMLMSVLSLLGASTLLTTNVEIKISGNTRTGQTALYSSDGIGQATSGILEDNIAAVGWTNNYVYGNVTVNHGSFPFTQAPGQDIANNPDITFPNPMPGTAIINRGPTVTVAGSSALSAAGFEGAGKGAAGGGLKTIFLIYTRGIVGTRATSLLFMSHDHYL
ncbi:MAG: hypothetical protein HQK55_13320 [Deltaproteobacteria bacterium]|nr:hypothetical protein [Deltaproteobacteria bacterium]